MNPRATALAAVLSIAAVLASRAGKDVEKFRSPAAPLAAARPPVASPSSVAQPLPDASLYQLASEWKDDSGAKLRLADLRGKARVLSLFFGHCESACPMTLGTLKGMEAKLPAGWADRAGIVLVTLDPGRDSGAALAGYRQRMGLDRASWTLLHGADNDTRELAMALGVAYRKSPANGGMEHDAVIAVLDPDGRIAHRHEGGVEASVLAEELRAAAGIR